MLVAMINKIVDYLRLVKFSHTIFAMPMALLAFTYAWVTTSPEQPLWVLLVQVVLCMVFARNVAMGFNRWADRKIDAENPRTAMREIPAGRVSPRGAVVFVVVNAVLFIAVAASINALCGWLSPVALAIVMFYSYCKRFTAMAHIVLGISLGIAPVGATMAVTGAAPLECWLLALVVMSWCAGFDIIYALQRIAPYGEHRAIVVVCLVPASVVVVVCGMCDVCKHRGIGALYRNAKASAKYRHRLRHVQRPGECVISGVSHR